MGVTSSAQTEDITPPPPPSPLSYKENRKRDVHLPPASWEMQIRQNKMEVTLPKRPSLGGPSRGGGRGIFNKSIFKKPPVSKRQLDTRDIKLDI